MRKMLTPDQRERLSDLVSLGPSSIEVVDSKGVSIGVLDILRIAQEHSDGEIDHSVIIKLDIIL